MLPEGDWKGPSVVTCCPTGVATDGGATVRVTGGGATTVTVVVGGAGIAGGRASVVVEITGVTVGA
jgi:hypothetical protein